MNTPNESTCPKCGTPIPGDAPRGLCPVCVLQGAASTTKATAAGGKTMPPPSVEEIAAHFPEMEILELLGAGGMGTVYKARQPQLDRFVALKILSHDLAEDPAFVERFNREAKVLARLNHPNIVGVHDFGTAGPYCYLTMEYVDGVNLRQAMQAGRFTPGESLAMAQHICSALKFAHEEGILHRDIKPENVLIDSKGRVKIADFGIAKLVGESRQPDVTLTMQGSVLGSPHYMAPEQIETPGDVDQRADIYSLGVVLYEMLTGELPIGRFPLPSEKAAMDARIDEIVLRTLAKERQARFQTAQEMSTRVDALTQSPAPAPNASAPARMESGMARFSLLSGILIAISLIFGIILAYLFSSFGDLEDIIRRIGAGWTILNLVVTFVAAAGGFLLGASALGEIRKSGGTKDGLGFAIFAVVAWPILCLGLLIIILLKTPMPGGGSIGMPIALLLTGVPYLLAISVLIRGLCRWARGVEKHDGPRHFPELTRTVLATLGLTCLGPGLAWVLPIVFSGASWMRPDPAREFVLHNESHIDWRLGGPELVLDLNILSDMNTEFHLVFRNGQGEPIRYETIGVWHAQAGPQFRKRFTLKIGTLGSGDDEAPETVGGFAAHLNLTGESVEIHDMLVSGKWHLEKFGDPAEQLYGGSGSMNIGVFRNPASLLVGECREMIDGTSTLTGTLELEIRSVQIR